VHQVPRVIKDGACLVVESAPAARVAAMVDRRNWNAMIQLRRYLKRVGVVKALEDAGVGPGDPVRIGKLEWEWE
jgi:Obg family GTPase CgtA-like protein